MTDNAKTTGVGAHTAGPWTARGVMVYADHNNGPLISTSESLRSGREFANARLAAAAPDLLEACERAVAYIETYVAECDPLIQAIQAAINKANGP